MKRLIGCGQALYSVDGKYYILALFHNKQERLALVYANLPSADKIPPANARYQAEPDLQVLALNAC